MKKLGKHDVRVETFFCGDACGMDTANRMVYETPDGYRWIRFDGDWLRLEENENGRLYTTYRIDIP